MHLRWGTIKNSVTHPYFFPPFPDFINRNGKTNAVSLINTLFRTLLGVIKIGTGVLFAGGWTGEEQRGWWEPPSGGSGIKGNWSSLCFLFPPEVPGRREINSSPSLLPEPSLSPFSHILPLPRQRSLICAGVSVIVSCLLTPDATRVYLSWGWPRMNAPGKVSTIQNVTSPQQAVHYIDRRTFRGPWMTRMDGGLPQQLALLPGLSEWVSEWMSEWVTNTLPMTGDTTWRRSQLHLSEASR